MSTAGEPLLLPDADAAWSLVEACYDPLRESSRESRFALSNGFLGVRSSQAINRPARCAVPPRTYVAGLFDVSGTDQPISGLIPAAGWVQVAIRLRANAAHKFVACDVSGHCRTLDMKRGTLLTQGRLRGPGGATVHLHMLRLVSLENRALGIQVIQLQVQGGDVEIRLEASSEPMDPDLLPDEIAAHAGQWHTRASGKRLSMAAAAGLELDGKALAASSSHPFAWSWTWQGKAGQVACFVRSIAFAREDGLATPLGSQAARALAGTPKDGWRGIVTRHADAWSERWRRSDVQVDGDPAAQQALRFALYHLNSAANPDDDRVSIGARALTGDDYRGHVFWDTEIFLLPFYALTWPEAARALLTYRFRTLDAARAKAKRMGWKGALYAWESTDTGIETTPDQAIGPDRKIVQILCGTQEQHISADVAYAVWQYWLAAGDEGFLRDAGAEILIETARFWASRAQPEDDGLCHIRGVIGPDEYHEGIDDNAFTNVMARWNIARAIDAVALLRARWPDTWQALSARLALDDAELGRWRAAADRIATGLDTRTGIFEQFEGFSLLEDIDLAGYVGRSVPMDVVLGRERTQRSQIIKQADVVALLALLPGAFAGGSAAANFDHYEPRCSHGSSLSRAMHAIAAARLGRSERALAYLRQASAIDLGDSHVSIDGGIHIAALGGVWMTAILGFAGLSLLDDALGFDPQLPEGWERLGFSVAWRGRTLRIAILPRKSVIEAKLEQGGDMILAVCGERYELHSGATISAGLHPRGGAAARTL